MTDGDYDYAVANLATLRAAPLKTVAIGKGDAVAITNSNGEILFYCVPAKTFEADMERLEDFELNAIADQRAGSPTIEVTLDEL